MVRIIWASQSIEDLENIYDFISKDSPRYAKREIIRIRDRARLLKKQPKLGRIVPEIEEEKIRELILGNFRIIYRIQTDNLVEIITIFHSSRILKID
jgi:toxin ParE1/3/4